MVNICLHSANQEYARLFLMGGCEGYNLSNVYKQSIDCVIFLISYTTSTIVSYYLYFTGGLFTEREGETRIVIF